MRKIIILLATITSSLLSATVSFSDWVSESKPKSDKVVLEKSIDLKSSTIDKYIPDAQKVGEQRFTYLLWNIYDASLYSSNGNFSIDQPYALKLQYLRFLKGDKIAERSALEIENQGFEDSEKLALWLNLMRDIFPDVAKGDSITGIRDKNNHTLFYFNDENIGVIKDTDFTEKFFGIWLSQNTSQPKMRKKLLNL